MNARYYDGGRGQFLSQDPSFLDIGGAGFEEKYERTLQMHLMNPQALNSYSYGLNNPIRYSDPGGEIVPALVLGALAFYGGYSAGTDLYEGYTNGDSGQFAWGAVGAMGSLVPGGSTVKGATTLIGKSFGKVGTVIKNTPAKINGFTTHGLDQIIYRGVSPNLLLDTTKNALVTLKQTGGNVLYLTNKAAVVLNKTGKIVTSYTSKDFKPHILNILKKVSKKKR